VNDRREPELPFGPGREAPPEPRDQAGFDALRPAPEHPAAGDFPPPPPTGGDGDGGDGEGDAARDAGDDDRMGLLDHLEELRSALIHSLIAAAAAAVLCWFWSADLLDVLIRPVSGLEALGQKGIFFTAPNEAFMTRLKLSAVVGLFVVAPFIFFRVYQFVLPGLYRHERRVVTPLLIATTALFYAGVAFAFFVVIPQVVAFLLGFGTDSLQPLIGVGPYFAFVSRLCLAFGLVFQLPLLVLFLSLIGAVNPRMLLRTWRYAVVIIAVMAAVLTPPDVASQVMMAVPVLVLYMTSVLVSILVTRRRRASADEPETDED
jgi:sec-independent protein translocase protein TatC